ncbi:MAG: hypothetical protein HYV09_01195 [Deltaproteobacteria bacterium]|nr:hypothetical protein [Deltaproteobacteria bacterium]
MKRVLAAALSTLAAASVFAFAPEAGATNYSLWIHGRNTSGLGAQGNYADFAYWGPSSYSAGVNKKSVNWGGVDRISPSNYRVRDALDCFCTGSNWCYIAAHSAGDAQIGYTLAMYGGSSRYKKNAVANSSGVCGNVDGTTQVGWNIKWIDVAAGAGGGSELADAGEWFVSDNLTADLVTTTTRALYNHNTTRSKWLYRFAGASGTLYSGLLPGQDDEVVSYHAAGGVSGTSGGSFCNPGDWFCDGDLYTGSNGTSSGRPLWSYQTVDFRDDGESYNHYTNGSWGGIVGKVRADMVTYAY